ncbi:large subunit ribosomal protein L7Ae [Enteropsectra breve]|nr:large subunit ribosomal protein L7Ae [Enteropsectra breve]
MAFGIGSKRIKKEAPVDPVVKEAKLQKKLFKLANAIRIPAPINQFKTTLENVDEQRLVGLFSKYKPETREAKRERLSSENPMAGPKPIITKFGMKHIVDLIERKALKLVVIAADVMPITVVIALPTLCKKMGVAYAIVPSKATLGALVNMKQTAAVGLADVRGEDAAEFNDLLRISNAVFADQYEKHMTTIGGGIVNKKEKSE